MVLQYLLIIIYTSCLFLCHIFWRGGARETLMFPVIQLFGCSHHPWLSCFKYMLVLLLWSSVWFPGIVAFFLLSTPSSPLCETIMFLYVCGVSSIDWRWIDTTKDCICLVSLTVNHKSDILIYLYEEWEQNTITFSLSPQHIELSFLIQLRIVKYGSSILPKVV